MLLRQANKLKSPEEYCRIFIRKDIPRKERERNEENI